MRAAILAILLAACVPAPHAPAPAGSSQWAESPACKRRVELEAVQAEAQAVLDASEVGSDVELAATEAVTEAKAGKLAEAKAALARAKAAE